uniref:Uncharacterized protein n=1 Tax=Chrysemys picta bellii TaxID=8478 RepID=A0A8C3F6H1_CHRPI
PQIMCKGCAEGIAVVTGMGTETRRTVSFALSIFPQLVFRQHGGDSTWTSWWMGNGKRNKNRSKVKPGPENFPQGSKDALKGDWAKIYQVKCYVYHSFCLSPLEPGEVFLESLSYR